MARRAVMLACALAAARSDYVRVTMHSDAACASAPTAIGEGQHF